MTYREPKKGDHLTPTQARIAEAVDNRDWQELRHSLKGKETATKLLVLQDYRGDQFDENVHLVTTGQISAADSERMYEDVQIRIGNYVSALARGGQIRSIGGDWRRYYNAFIGEELVILK